MSHPTHQQAAKSPGNILGTAGILFCFSLLVFILWLSRFAGASFGELLGQYKNMLVYPNMNKFIVGEIRKHNVIALFYWFCGLVSVLVGLYYLVFVHAPGQKNVITLPRLISWTLIACLLCFGIIQQCHRYDYYEHERDLFAGKTLEEKQIARFGSLYQFPKATQDALKNRIRGTMVTDYDLTKSPYMFHHRVLSYFFYPKVSLRYDNGTPNDGLFLYAKQNPLQAVPENYRIVLSSEDKSFIFALQKNTGTP